MWRKETKEAVEDKWTKEKVVFEERGRGGGVSCEQQLGNNRCGIGCDGSKRIAKPRNESKSRGETKRGSGALEGSSFDLKSSPLAPQDQLRGVEGRGERREVRGGEPRRLRWLTTGLLSRRLLLGRAGDGAARGNSVNVRPPRKATPTGFPHAD